MADRAAFEIRISGRVQGVAFRAWMQRRAEALGISGWVRNCANGEVEALVSGPAEAVETLIAACRSGPSAARVTDVRIVGRAEPAEGPFTILPDRSN